MKRFLLWFLREEIRNMLYLEVERAINRKLKDLEATDTVIPTTNTTWVRPLSVLDVIDREVSKLTNNAINATKAEFAKEEFIDKITERINKKQIKTGV